MIVSSDMTRQVVLDMNPFAVLDVTTRDTRERIYDAVEDRSLIVDLDSCNEARAILTAPRRRFEAELGWFPGIAPTTAKRALGARNLEDIEALSIGGLALANALTTCAVRRPPASLDQLVAFLTTISAAIDSVSLETTLRDVNEDREIAGFPPFTSADTAEEMLRDRRQIWRSDVVSVLARMPTHLMIEGLYLASERMAQGGSFPQFMHSLVEDYGLRAQPFLQNEMAGAIRLIEKAQIIAGSHPRALSPLIDALAELLTTWEKVTKPIQLTMTHLGRIDPDSERLGYLIRDLSIDLYNQHCLTDEARRLSVLLSKRFSSLPELAGRIGEDQDALDRLAREATEREAEIAYAADIGIFRKSRLSINSRRLEWKGQHYDVKQIRSARWGAIKKSVNGIPAGTDYLIAWSDENRTAIVKFRKGIIYEAFIERLLRVLAEPMLSAMTLGLQNGREFHFGGAAIRDNSVTLPCTKIFGKKRTEFGWGEVTVRNADGFFIIEGPPRSKASVRLSFRNVANVHFLEILVRTAFQNGRTQLSTAFA
ncbi:hypothetical protein AAC691_04865 [Nguyenibacter vanlangensis]|uniref:Uncharacterized protein n=1 Tax=Nguyenibacter vanlangensis TaxID=1216886 RepID=A0ABZ3D7P0_9PROT